MDEIDERVLNEFFVYLCCDNPDILHKNVLIFSKCSFCCLLCGKEGRKNMKIMNKFIDSVSTNV